VDTQGQQTDFLPSLGALASLHFHEAITALTVDIVDESPTSDKGAVRLSPIKCGLTSS
jgi:hypothetical protein